MMLCDRDKNHITAQHRTGGQINNFHRTEFSIPIEIISLACRQIHYFIYARVCVCVRVCVQSRRYSNIDICRLYLESG